MGNGESQGRRRVHGDDETPKGDKEALMPKCVFKTPAGGTLARGDDVRTPREAEATSEEGSEKYGQGRSPMDRVTLTPPPPIYPPSISATVRATDNPRPPW